MQRCAKRQSFFSVFGAEEADHLRVLANLPADQFEELLQDWKFEDTSPLAALLSSGTPLRWAPRTVCQSSAAVKTSYLNLIRERNLARAPTAAAAAPAADSGEKRVKLAAVLEGQGARGEVVKEAYERFAAVAGEEPAPHEELTRDQLSGLHALQQGSGPPCVDFIVWGPFGHRFAKRVKLTGMVIGAGGQLQPTELFGPPDIETWSQSFRVWRTGLIIILDAVSPGTLDAYHDMVRQHSMRCTASTWVLQYQADVRRGWNTWKVCGAEVLHCWLRVHWSTAVRPSALGTGHCGLSSRTQAFWAEELMESVVLVLARANRLSDLLDGDVVVRSSGGKGCDWWQHGSSALCDPEANTAPASRRS